MRFHLPYATFLATAAAIQPLGAPDYVGKNGPYAMKLDRFDSDFQNVFVQAKNGKLYAGLPIQGAQGCSVNRAFFHTNNGELFLKTPSTLVQRVYTDISGQGAGVVGYQTLNGAPSPTIDAVSYGWAISTRGDLIFKQHDVLVCPSKAWSGAWDVWLDTGLMYPAGYTGGCLLAPAKLIPVPLTEAPDCTYT